MPDLRYRLLLARIRRDSRRVEQADERRRERFRLRRSKSCRKLYRLLKPHGRSEAAAELAFWAALGNTGMRPEEREDLFRATVEAVERHGPLYKIADMPT